MGIRNLSLTFTAQELRDIVGEIISKTIDIHRGSQIVEYDAVQAMTPATEEEIDDFLASNPLLDDEVKLQLTDPGLLGFSALVAQTSPSWIEEFRRNVKDWSQNHSWLGADEPVTSEVVAKYLSESQVWHPSREPQPPWLSTSRTAILLAADLLRKGRLLSELPWRKFEELIGELLESQGWRVEVTKATRDGGIDVIAQRVDKTIGPIRSIWQAKRYGPRKHVVLSDVRELSGILDRDRATKGVIVTTSQLTKDAIEWIRRDKYRLDFKDADRIEAWIRSRIWQ